ncbi:MAG: hypothetical protein HN842_00165 [Gammaproteobacteria bacterium]|nr:hypothetical protein [Gammaproteobacteria bacterium]MBT7306594.1 hypothetical protein [Gammaproteobacteria bacterium]
MRHLNQKMGAVVLALTLAISLTVVTVPASAAASDSSWRPQVSEKLIRLPASYLKRAIDRDFSQSSLAGAIEQKSSDLQLKSQTMQDLQKGIERSEGELKTEMRHQFLVEKERYLDLTAEQIDLRKRHVKTRITFYERLLGEVEQHGADSEEEMQLLEQQQDAVKRFEGSVAKVDMKLFGQMGTQQSKYSKEYTKNLSAIERLVGAIQGHKMNATTQVDGEAISKPDYLRRMITESESEVALLEQEETILGYMAKLISLDALALSEEVDDPEWVDSEVISTSVASAIDFFVSE